MCVRNLIGSTLVLTLLFFPGLVGCQTETDYATMRDKIDELSRNVKKLSDDMDEAARRWVTPKDIDALREKIVAGEHELVQIKADLAAANARQAKETNFTVELASLKAKLARLEKDLQTINEVAIEQRKIIDQIVKTDGAGNATVAIGRVTTDPQFSSAVDEAVGKAISRLTPPAWNTVRIDNRMLTSQYIEVNGGGHWIAPQSILDVEVPAGWATTRLVGYEAAKSWWLGTPNYIQRVIIDHQPLYDSFVRYP